MTIKYASYKLLSVPTFNSEFQQLHTPPRSIS